MPKRPRSAKPVSRVMKCKPPLSPPKLPMGQNTRWDAMTDYEREQVTTHILEPLVQHVVQSLACLIWEFTEQGPYEAYDCVELQARQGPYISYNGPTFHDISLMKPELKRDKNANAEDIMFSTDGFQTSFRVEVPKFAGSRFKHQNTIFSCERRTLVFDHLRAWEDCTEFRFKTPPDYIWKTARHACKFFLKLIEFGNRIFALFLDELLIFENEVLLVRLHVHSDNIKRVDFHDIHVRDINNLVVAFCYNLIWYQIKYLQFYL